MKLQVVDPLNYKKGKKLLMGGGQFANSFMVVNLKAIRKAINPPIPCKYQAVVTQKEYKGYSEFTPWMASWWLAELPEEWRTLKVNSYTWDLNGNIIPKYN